MNNKGFNHLRKLLAFLLVASLAAAGFSQPVMAKAKKMPTVRGITLKIGKKKVTKKTYPMKRGEKKKIKVSVSPAKGKNVIQFATGNKKVAAVSKKGTVTAKKAGTAKIKVTVRKKTSGKKGRASKKKSTWVKIKVAEGSQQKDNTASDAKTSSMTPTPENPTPSPSVAPTLENPTPSPSVAPTLENPTPSPSVVPTPDGTLPPEETGTPLPSASPESGGAKQGKSLVVYFSCTGTTKKIAEYIQEITGADIYRIEPEEPYTAEDLNYGDSTTRATREQNDPSARPAIAGKVENMSQYRNVVIAYPIWWGQAPKIVSTFLESYDFSGKTIVPVCTSHSSGIGSSAANLHALADSTATWYEGARFSSGTSKEEVAQWLQDSGIQELFAGSGVKMQERVFDFNTKTVTLNSGYQMPLNGLGTYSLTGDTCVKSVSEALKRGVRLIDTAYMYGNEAEVGKAVRESGIPREEIFVITKLYPSQFDEPEKAIDEALKKLDIGYIDMMLLHHPGTGDVKAYKAMEQAVQEGKIRSIGLSNWYVEELQEFLPQVSITPALVQNEIHPYYQENDVIPYIHNLGIVVQGWYPLGGRGHTAELLGDETISEIAKAHGKSSAQVILRWNLQKGVVVIPGSSNPDHIQENTELYDFELTEEEMRQINALDRNEKHDWY